MLPLLFNLVVKTLPILVSQFEDNQWLQGMWINGMQKRTTTVEYADDTIMFLGCSEDMDVILHRCLLIFFIISGLCVNLYKSSLVEVGIDHAKVNRIPLAIGC